MFRAVWCRPENALLECTNPAVPVYIPGPGSAGDAPGRISSAAVFVTALSAPGAVALFARGWPQISAPINPTGST